MNQQEILDRINKLERRNELKDSDKAWETSWWRRILIALLTYALLSCYMMVIGVSNPFLSAVIPTTGFLLSTLTLSIAKAWWLKHFYSKK